MGKHQLKPIFPSDSECPENTSVKRSPRLEMGGLENYDGNASKLYQSYTFPKDQCLDRKGEGLNRSRSCDGSVPSQPSYDSKDVFSLQAELGYNQPLPGQNTLRRVKDILNRNSCR